MGKNKTLSLPLGSLKSTYGEKKGTQREGGTERELDAEINKYLIANHKRAMNQ